MKLVAKIFAGFVVLVAAGIGAVFYMTSDMVTVVDDFFSEVQKGDYQAAHSGLAKGFQETTSVEELKKFLETSHIADYQSSSWSSRSFQNDTGKLEGTITTKDGASIPVKMEFVKESGNWKIFGIFRSVPGLSNSTNKTQPTELKIPPNDRLVEIVRASTKVFGQAIDARDMSIFHNAISRLWSEQYTVQQLDEAYRSLYKLGAKWSSLENLSPIFDSEPQINSDGVMIVDGHYPTKPDTLLYTYKYILEGQDWKLLGVHIRFRSPEASKPASE